MSKSNVARNTTYYTAALTVQKILAFIYFWFISNDLVPGELGQYVFALSFTTLFSIIVDLGLSPILTREASKSEADANRYLQNVIGLKLPLAIIATTAAWIVIYVTNRPENVRLLVYIATAVMLLDSFSVSFWGILRARQNLKYESIATILVQVIIFSLGLTALKVSGEVKYLMLALLAASTFNFLLVALLLKFKLHFSLRPRHDKDTVKYFMKIVPAFAIAGIFIKIYNAADSVLLGYLDSEAAVGFYAVPAKVVYALQQIIPVAFAAAIFPAFSYFYVHDRLKLEQTFSKAFIYLTILGIPLAVGIMTLADRIITLIWPSYAPVIPTFFVMAAAIPFIFWAFPTGYLLNACDRQKYNTINRGIVTALAVILNIALIPYLSYLGSGITFLITNVILIGLDFYWVTRTISVNVKSILASIGKSVLAAAGMGLVAYFGAQTFSVILVIPFAAACYFIFLYLLKGFTLQEAVALVHWR